MSAIFAIVIIVFYMYLVVRVLHKAGYSGWWALTQLTPLTALVGYILFAYAVWPVEMSSQIARRREARAYYNSNTVQPGGAWEETEGSPKPF